MCPDQLFAALSAWYMCAISFNRWYSVWRPSSYFIRQSFQAARAPSISINTTNINDTNCVPKKVFIWINDPPIIYLVFINSILFPY